MFFSRVRIKPEIGESSNLHRLIQGNIDSPHQLLWDLFPGQDMRNFLYREEIANEQAPLEKGIRGEPIYYMVSQTLPEDRIPLFSVESKEYCPKVTAGDRLMFKLRANPVVTRRNENGGKSIRHDVVMDAQRDLLVSLSEGIKRGTVPKKSELKRRILVMLGDAGNEKALEMIRENIKSNERFKNLPHQTASASKLLAWAIKARCDSALGNWISAKGLKNGFQLVSDQQSGRLKFQAESYRWHALPRKGKTAGFSSVDFDGALEVVDPDKFLQSLFNGIGPAKAFGCGLDAYKADLR